MQREDRYLVIKRSDVVCLSEFERQQLFNIIGKVARCREVVGKEPLKCVVVESDWPEYEPTWQAIERRVDGGAQCLADAKSEESGLKNKPSEQKNGLESDLASQVHLVQGLIHKIDEQVDCVNGFIEALGGLLNQNEQVISLLVNQALLDEQNNSGSLDG